MLQEYQIFFKTDGIAKKSIDKFDRHKKAYKIHIEHHLPRVGNHDDVTIGVVLREFDYDNPEIVKFHV